jgi:hypothetical protein
LSEKPYARIIPLNDTTICEGDSVDLEIAFDRGTPPYTLTITDGVTEQEVVAHHRTLSIPITVTLFNFCDTDF